MTEEIIRGQLGGANLKGVIATMGLEGATQIRQLTNADKVLLFSEAYHKCNGNRDVMRELLGGKGAGLAEMTVAGVNVPPGMTLTTLVCHEYYENGQKVSSHLLEEVRTKLSYIEKQLDRKLGDKNKPLLLSVRSGAKYSMPGMMDTVLNLGLNDETVESLTKVTNNSRFAWDSYRRFIQMYSNVVLGINKDRFENLLNEKKKEIGITSDMDLSSETLKDLVYSFKKLVKAERKVDFEQDTFKQLMCAVEAVFKSWNNARAIYYRNLHGIDHNLGTAVNIQTMVFGNYDRNSATGVCFTRNPSTGEKTLYGEYLVNAQGEDVVAGIRTPCKITDMSCEMPNVYQELQDTAAQLEQHYKEMQDIEFTIQQGELYLLQTRTGKRTAVAAVKIAVDMATEGIISVNEALSKVEAAQLNQLLLPCFKEEDKQKAIREKRHLATGLNASPGAAMGEIVFDPEESEQLAEQGKKIILVRVETCPDDIHGIVPAQGIITSRGGMTSHAAVVARGMGKPCIVGCEAFNIDLEGGKVTVGTKVLQKGDIISIDGSTGEIFTGVIATQQPELSNEFQLLLKWADQVRVLKVRANADTAYDAKLARDFGAEGIGLTRTEHMFMSQERLPVVQAMIMATTSEEREAALRKLLPMQREDFIGIFRAMHGLPVTIRLLDPPLHEFLPKYEELLEEVVSIRAKGIKGAELRKKEILLQKVRELKEANPMMGLRGCRLGLLFPEINRMQIEAIFEAAVAVNREGLTVLPEIMIPLISHANELKVARLEVDSCARKVMQRLGVSLDYKFGTMIEVPRACVTADEIAEHAEFFSFGTNDLTQMTFGYSRDDAEGKFLQRYLEGIAWEGNIHRILIHNPFEVLDQNGVGKLMKIAVEYGLQTRVDLKVGICGEHGGETSSIAFAHQLGLNYVSCSPYRVPLARLAAAQATLVSEEKDK